MLHTDSNMWNLVYLLREAQIQLWSFLPAFSVATAPLAVPVGLSHSAGQGRNNKASFERRVSQLMISPCDHDRSRDPWPLVLGSKMDQQAAEKAQWVTWWL